MPRNGSGVASLPSNSFNPAVSGAEATPADWNDTAGDIESMLTTSIASNGVTTPTANLPMGGFKHTGVGAASARTQYGTVAGAQDGSYVYAVSSGASAYTVTMAPAVTSLVTGMKFRVRVASTNPITTPTLAVNGTAAKTVVNTDGTALVASQLVANSIYEFTYNATLDKYQVNSLSTASFATKTPQYLVLAVSADLTNERRLAFASTSFTTSDGGAGSAFTVSLAANGIVFSKLDADIFAAASAVTIVATDYLVLSDASDSNETKRGLVSDIVTLATPSTFTSSDQTITSAGSLTLAHGLSGTPTKIWAQAVCQTGEGNWTPGDAPWIAIPNDPEDGRGFMVWPDATNINVRYGSDANVLVMGNKTTGGLLLATNANWKIRFHAML